ncbi:hypothetical protein KKG41_04825 [Patescibacteria group bacterium]|nr:hypothetical protein [Patescibacteria group bacterium]
MEPVTISITSVHVMVTCYEEGRCQTIIVEPLTNIRPTHSMAQEIASALKKAGIQNVVDDNVTSARAKPVPRLRQAMPITSARKGIIRKRVPFSSKVAVG